MVDGDDVVRASAHEADLVGLAMGKAGVESRAPPARAMRVDQLFHLRGNTLALERLDHQVALPFAIKRGRHVLRGAAAAPAEPAAEWLGALGRSVEGFDKLRAFSLKPDPRPLARQRQGNDCAIGSDAGAVRIERDDGNLFERLSHGARR